MRLDTGIFDSEWVYLLSPMAQLAWIRLLLHVKTEGVKGTAKALSVPVASKKWGIPESDIQAMLTAAREDGALAEGAEWSVTNWLKYQESPSAERVRKHRALQDANVTPESVTDGYSCRVTETETETETGNISFFPESASFGNTTPPEEEDSLRLPVTGSPEKEKEATPWFEDGVSETRELREAAAKVAATRIRSRSKQFPYRGISVADAKRVLKALAPCPSPEDARLFWDSWYAYHADRTKPPYTQLGQAVENWARKRTVEWARLKRHEEAVARNSRGAHDNIPTWTPGGAA
jgi:hypothetical protein